MTQYQRGRLWLAERPYVIAIFITLVLVLWMLSGVMQAKEIPTKAEKQSAVIPKVKVETLVATQVHDTVELYGRTEPDRITTLKAEISGQVTEVLAQRGSRVIKGQVIARLALNDLQSQLTRSQALLKQREIEYQGAKKLNAEGYQGKAQLSSAQANLAAVKADIKRYQIAIENTVIKAPFDGVLNTRYVEQGDYVQSGDDIAMIADLDPLVVRAYVTENQIAQLSVGQSADISLLNKQAVQGRVRYIASVANEATNTFKIEVTIDNADYQLLAGLSSEVNIALEQVPAIKISPALLALDDKGNIGVKTVAEDKVVFTPINVVKSESDGLWLTGLGQQANIITLGQGFVRDGDVVEAVMATNE
ncbi:hemolysin D [Thalassotalea insulae]|uniref:Hemolysin D n=1 Tax=Thalassotalea insulae TaxID=2056778 RepID=A0ABQ6GPN9_9GAMM|nr:efflux RND transporter periplasmic adaptor subunit [Thalassotalea insulae]GLX77892.1 hemolysin D [Thalassotalea insulae]